ncbi:MAG: glycolate oxidase subunit GlcE [Pseudomonadota bacterium]|nr:glycolate oxidase subunit GlcE [Pseudomonadota bacterium]MEC7236566.1 glycolate oxidase subunit GlcE [Pseudomonadota bacterium]
MTDFQVNNLGEVAEAVQQAMAEKARLEVRAAGTKRHLGRASNYDHVLDVSALSGIVDYQPEELVLTLRAGTPMNLVEAALADARQMLAFEPPSMTRILGEAQPGVRGTIGGVIAANLSGPRRLTAGAARDYRLGVEAVSGRGELFKSGGKVMKNVTGYDLSKLMCGSFGTLGVMDEITLKTLPAPETSRSLVIGADDIAGAVSAIAGIFASPHEPGASAILPSVIAAEEGVDSGSAFTIVIRLEGIEASVADRLGHLQEMTGGEALADQASVKLWQRIRDVQPLAEKPLDIWKVSCAPADAARVVGALESRLRVRMIIDWAGGLVWVAGSSPQIGPALRKAVAGLQSGFAMLVRDVGATREKIAPFEPLAAGMFALHKRVKSSFDPLGVLNFERMHEGI